MTAPFDDPEASRPTIPADVLAFVAEVEARHTKTTPGKWVRSVGGRIVRVEEFVDEDHDDGVDICETLLSADDAEFVEHAHADVPMLLAIVREQAASEQGILDAAMKARFDLEALDEENKALRERLAKLETTLAEFVELNPVSTDCQCGHCWFVRRCVAILNPEKSVSA